MTKKTVCKKCGKELETWDDIGFLLLMTDDNTCPNCEWHDYDKWSHETGLDDFVYKEDSGFLVRKLGWPCFRCVRTAIHCKDCGRKIILHQIKEYHPDFKYPQ